MAQFPTRTQVAGKWVELKRREKKKRELVRFFNSDALIGHKNWLELKHLILVKFHVPGVMKIGEN